ncbi:MAG: fdsD [Nevskia sp.]|nr:fdsD [Nevskia sp.]
MSHDPHQHLVEMANDIGAFFATGGREHDAAVGGIVDHLQKFWEPRMRRKIIEHLHQGGAGMDEPVKEAIRRLEAAAAPAVN